jgi:hypothetical protein
MGLYIFKRAADEVAHIDERGLGQIMHLLHGYLGGRAGRSSDVCELDGAGNVDAAPDRLDPRRAGIRNDDAGSAEDRQPADDAETPVQGFFRQRLAAGNGNLHRHVTGIAVSRSDLSDCLADHLPGHRIDRRLTGRNGKAGTRHRADALAGAERYAAPWCARPHRRQDQSAVGDVGIIASVLDHARRRAAVVTRGGRERKGRPLPARQGDLYRIGELAREQRGISRLRGGGGARTGGPALAERVGALVHGPRYRAPMPFRHAMRAA